MRTVVALRWTGALWFVPVVFAVGVYTGVREVAVGTGYPVADLAAASYQRTLIGPLVAAYCAFRFGGFARSLDTLAPRRPGIVATLGAWWPLVIGPPVASVVALFVSTQGAWPTDATAWQIVGLVFLVTMACGVFGMALGYGLPAPAAIPLAAAATFWWLAFPGSGTNVLLRTINSGFVVCCTSATVPSPVMLRGSAVFAGALVLAVFATWLVPRWSRRGRGFGVASIVLVLVVAFGSAKVYVDASPVRPTFQAIADRTTPRTCEQESSARVCVWPEDSERIDLVGAYLGRLNPELLRRGLAPITLAAQDVTGTRGVGFTADASLTRSDVLYSLSDGYARWRLACQGASAPRDPSAAAVALLGLLGGLPESYLRGPFSDEVIAAAKAAQGGDDADVVASLGSAAGAPDECGG